MLVDEKSRSSIVSVLTFLLTFTDHHKIAEVKMFISPIPRQGGGGGRENRAGK
jgi:hypothetical protein